MQLSSFRGSIFATIAHQSFFLSDHYPALFYALAALAGACFGLAVAPFSILFTFLSFISFPLLFLPPTEAEVMGKRMVVALAAFIGMFFYVYLLPMPSPLPKSGVQGRVLFRPENVSKKKIGHRTLFFIQGTLSDWQASPGSEGEPVCKGEKVVVRLQAHQFPAFPIDQLSLLAGKLSTKRGSYRLLLDGSKAIEKRGGWAPAELRFRIKEWLETKIFQSIHDRECAAFLFGIITGDFSSKKIRYALSRFGLQHLMAISGFHFALFSGAMSGFFAFFLGKKWASLCSLSFLFAYFAFLGHRPSVSRAFIFIVLHKGAPFLMRRSKSRNLFGVALLLLLLYDPREILDLSLSLSFLATFAILFCHPLAMKGANHLFPQRKWSELKKMALLQKIGYLGLKMIQPALSIALAVHIALTPYLLFTFGRVPLLSPLFNLFMPPLTALLMVILLLFLLSSLCLPLLASLCAMFLEYTLHTVLGILLNLPTGWDLALFLPGIPEGVVFLFYLLLFLFVVYWGERKRRLDIFSLGAL